MSWSRTVILTGAALCVSACGFQMRGQSTLPVEMDRTYIAAEDRFTLFYRKLEDELRQSGVEITESAAEATAILTILDDQTGQRVLSVSARNVPREYEVFYRIRFSVESGENRLIEPQEQALIRDYTWDETRVLGKTREERLLREAIADDLVQLVMFQLAAL